MNRKVCHLTSVHARYDTRIFVKECQSLAKNGFEVYLIVADGRGNEKKGQVTIIDVGRPSGRLKRILYYSKKVYKKALELNADIYHFHDPELLPTGLKLFKKNKKVIYDSHEDLPRQLLDKPYIPRFLRKPVSLFFESFENRVASKISGVVTVTPGIKERFLESNSKVALVRNFPVLEEFTTNTSAIQKKEPAVCYVGGISKIRGVLNMVDALAYAPGIKLLLGGKFESNELRDKVEQSKGWNQVDELGFLNRLQVSETFQKSVAGLVVLEPTMSYLKSIPIKMFEYMAAGIPFIASDFEYWRELIEDVDCALFVDPQNPVQIGNAIRNLVDNKEMATRMGQNGKKAVYENFNWLNEELTLIEFYREILS